MDFGIQLKAHTDSVDARLRELLPSESDIPQELHAAMRYACLAPGKRIRPALCMACAEAVGGKASQALDAACAIEMVHCFSLVHDDLPAIDNDDLRRGQPTCHVKFGEAVALLAGDALFALAFRTLSSAPLSADRVIESLRALSCAVGSDGLVGGEIVDVLSEGKPASAETLETIHSRKTAALIGAACEIGALMGGGDENVVGRLRVYGLQMGMAFQIADDILNETGAEDRIGKAVGSDRRRQKATYPGLYGLDGARARAATAVDSALAQLPGNQPFLEALARFSIERTH